MSLFSIASPLLVARPILLTIPDICGRGIQLLPVEMMLKSSFGGSYNISRFQYDSSNQTLEQSGQELLQVLHTIKPHSSIEPCYILTHGYGALVLREAFRSIDWNHVRTKLVMVAPPNRGMDRFTSQTIQKWFPNKALDQVLKFQGYDLDIRLGKLPRLTRSMVIAGTLSIPQPWKSSQHEPCDGQISLASTHLPGEYLHMTVSASHNLLMIHPSTIRLIQSFLI